MLFKPDNFRGDWYGYLTNQVSHIGFGILLVWIISFVFWLWFGEFPLKTLVWMFMVLMYFVYELLSQGWRGFDTIEDTMFTTLYGSGGALYTFTEVDIGSPLLSIDIHSPLPIFLAAIVHLVAGCVVRYKRKKDDDRRA